MLAIVNNVKTSHKVIAVCEWATYDVWGNSRDGFDVNDVYRQGEIEIPVNMTISNVPHFPGAKDNFREFSDENASFSVEMMVCFTLDDADIKKALNITCKVEIDSSDGMHYTINKQSNAKPLAEVTIISWKPAQ